MDDTAYAYTYIYTYEYAPIQIGLESITSLIEKLNHAEVERGGGGVDVKHVRIWDFITRHACIYLEIIYLHLYICMYVYYMMVGYSGTYI